MMWIPNSIISQTGNTGRYFSWTLGTNIYYYSSCPLSKQYPVFISWNQIGLAVLFFYLFFSSHQTIIYYIWYPEFTYWYQVFQLKLGYSFIYFSLLTRQYLFTYRNRYFSWTWGFESSSNFFFPFPLTLLDIFSLLRVIGLLFFIYISLSIIILLYFSSDNSDIYSHTVW